MKLRGRVLAAVVAAGVVVAAGIGLLLGNIVHLRTTSDRTIESDAYLVRTMQVETLVVDAETGLRGYVITGDPSFLQPLTQAQQRIGRATSRLEQAATVETAFVPDALGLNRSAQTYLSDYVPQVVQEMRSDPRTARSTPTTLRGKQLVDAIRSQTSQLEQQVAARLDARQRAAHTSANRAVTLGIVMLVGLTLLTIALGALLARLFHARESARERASFLAEAGTQLDRLVTGEDVLREFTRLSEERGAESPRPRRSRSHRVRRRCTCSRWPRWRARSWWRVRSSCAAITPGSVRRPWSLSGSGRGWPCHCTPAGCRPRRRCSIDAASTPCGLFSRACCRGRSLTSRAARWPCGSAPAPRATWSAGTSTTCSRSARTGGRS